MKKFLYLKKIISWVEVNKNLGEREFYWFEELVCFF